MRNSSSNGCFSLMTGLLLAGSIFFAGSARAANGTWTNDANGSWGTAANWLENAVPGGTATDAVAFTNNITADRAVTLDNDRTVNSLTFGDADTNSAAGWKLTPGSGGRLTLAGTIPTLSVNTLASNKVATLSVGLSGSNGLTKAGLGTLTLTATNTYSGDTVIAAGTLQLGLVPLPPSSGLALWLDATRGVTTNGSGKVTVWADQSGNNRNASNSGSSGPSVTADINGLPTLRFTRSSSQFLSAGGLGGVSNLTLFIVHKDATLTALQTYIATDGTWRDDGMYGKSVHFITANSGGFRIDYAVYNGDGLGTTTMAAGVAQIDEIVDNSGPYQLYLNGAANGSASRAAVLKNLNAFRIGTWDQQSRFLDSSIGDILIYTNVLSTTERQMVGMYLKGKWGITGTYSGVNQDVLPAATSVAITNGAALVLKTSAQTIGSLTGEAGGLVALDTLLTVNGSSSTTYAGNISGAGGLTKQGNGVLTLSGVTNSFTGDTTVEGGTLTVKNTALSSGRLVMGPTGTLGYDISTNTFNNPRTDLSGTGSFVKTGAGALNFGAWGVVNWNFSSGARIDVKQGTLIGGWAINDYWVNNHASLSVSNGAAFRGMEANVRVTKLTGAGTVKTGYLTYASGYQSFTVGVDGESSTFDGTIVNDESGGTVGALTKTGAGLLTLTGSSSYTGHTTVDGGTLKVTGKLYANGNDSNTTVTVRNGGVLELDTWGYGAGASLGLLTNDASRLAVSNGTIRVNGGSLSGRGATIQAGGATLEANSNAFFSVCDAGAPWVFNGNPTLTLAGAGTGTFEMGFAGTGALVKSGAGKWTLAGTNAYSGSVQVQSGTLQVMADVPTNTPAPGAAMWLDATRGVTTTIASGGKVTVWADQSGNGLNATNIWNTGPTVTTDINGLPTLRFTRSSSQFLGTGGLGGVSNLTLFIVHKDASINTFQTFIGTDGAWRNDTTNGLSVHLIASYTGAHPLNYAVYNADANGTANMVAGTAQIDEILDNGGPWQLFLNGAANGSGSRATVVKNLDSFRIGSWSGDGSRYLDSSIGEILIYTNVLNAAQRQATYAYLNGKWFNPARYGIIQSASSNLLASGAAVTVAAAAVLDLAGKSQTITSLSGGGVVTNGTLTVTNGTITPGGSNTVGTLTLALTPTLSGTLRVDIGAAGASDRLAVAGALNVSGLALVVENPSQLDKNTVYTIATSTGSLTGSFSSTPNFPASWFVRYNRPTGTAQLVYRRGTMICVF